MAFNASKHDLAHWSAINNENRLIKIARTFNSENLVANEYKTTSATSLGGPSLYIEYIYDTSGNILAENKEVREWTQTQEDINTGASATEIEAGGDNVTAATQTTYTTDTTNVQYWLGLETDGQLTKTHIGTATSTRQIYNYALPTTVVGGICLERVYSIDTSVITGHQDIIGVWTQPMQDIVAPPITSIKIEGGTTATTVEDQLVGTDLGTLTTNGANTGHGEITWSLTSTTLAGDQLRIVGDELEVGPNAIGTADAGTYNVVVKATDELGAEKESTFVLTVEANDITDIALTAASINYGDAADTAIGTLSYTGGVGEITPVITSNGGMTNLRLDGNILESGPSWMNTAAGTYTVRITVTDQASTPQTYYEDFTITVVSTAITDIALSAASVNYGDAADTAIGTLSFTGGVSTVTPTISNAGGMTNIRLDGNVLEVGPSTMNTAAGTYSVTILATDTRGQTYSESFTITVVSTAITDIALSGLTVLNTAVDGDDIGNLTCVGGVGDVAYSITAAGGLDNVKVTDTGSSTATLEVDTGGIIDPVGTYTIGITATDTAAPPQTFTETFDIVVYSAFTNTMKFNTNTRLINDNKISMAGPEALIIQTNDWTISWWYKGTDTMGEFAGIYSYNKFRPMQYDGRFTLYPQGSTWGGYNELIDGNWHHIVMVNKASTLLSTYSMDAHETSEATPGISVYIDGAKASVIANATSSSTIGDAASYFSWMSGSNWHFADGEYDEMAIFNEMKTALQIDALYNDGTATDLSGDSTCVCWLRADTEGLGTLSHEDPITNDAPTGTYTATYQDPAGSDLVEIDDY